MASITDLIKQQVLSSVGGVAIPANIKDKVVNGLSESVLGSLTQTAAKAGGIDQITDLLKGKSAAATSPVTQLATKLFTNNILKNLSLDAATGKSLTGILPMVMSKLSGIIKDQDGDGDIDLQDFLIALKGGSSKSAQGSLLGAAAKGILGSLMKK